jgi:hypothetical protein
MKAPHSFETAESAYPVTQCQLHRNLNNSVKIPKLAKQKIFYMGCGFSSLKSDNKRNCNPHKPSFEFLF